MKRSIFIAAILFPAFLSLNADAQTKTKANASQPVPQTQPTSKVDKKISEVDTTIGKAKATASRAKDLYGDVITIFGSKTPNEGAIVIPAIEFDDANLEALVAAVKERKEVKKANVQYTDGTATIKITLKGKSGMDFWSELPKEVKDAFKMRSKQENNILVEYKTGNVHGQQLAQN